MPNHSPMPTRTLTPGDVSAVIQMAWEDRTAFETIQERIGVTEPHVIAIMRKELTPSSFKCGVSVCEAERPSTVLYAVAK